MDPTHLRLLRELRDRGSVTAVAAALGISASAVSQQLATLQSSVALPLTVRRGRVLILTAAGEALAAASTRVDEALTAARDAIGALLDAGDRPVRVSSFTSAGLALFGPLVRELGGAPAVHLADEDVAHRDFPGLTADYDLVIAHRLAHDAPWPADRVVATPLIDEPLDIALHAEHPLAERAQIDLDDLVDEDWVSVHQGFPLAGVLDHLAARAGRPFRIAHRINEFSVTAEVVRAGAAIAVMPRTTASSLAVDGLVLRPLGGIELVRHLDVLARPDALAYTSVRRVLRSLQVVAARVQQP
ncbi:DNA-binding transcriptional LysR family regulator [Microbacterium phyllosphaerae]|uniref:DNA-binding transcriptional LysR family regulator n=1 Tax=Microbacterium phyllosphaerae TaxID=124798 RepID=A0ABS4WKV9_9MICO|nr:LysR family transcriptional regulator [Microbacterium phyllosphaerae]MBP2376836.1 DNA-binding transcriptional LysR family regulator [Microbacterium phyllosphaerae]